MLNSTAVADYANEMDPKFGPLSGMELKCVREAGEHTCKPSACHQCVNPLVVSERAYVCAQHAKSR